MNIYPYIRGYFVASFPYFITKPVPYAFVSVNRRNNEAPGQHCFIIPSMSPPSHTRQTARQLLELLQLATDLDNGAESSGLERLADGDVAVERHEDRDPDGGRLSDEGQRQEVDLDEVRLLDGPQSGVLEEVGDAVERKRHRQHHSVNHRQTLQQQQQQQQLPTSTACHRRSVDTGR